jgi:hypothetical protein
VAAAEVSEAVQKPSGSNWFVAEKTTAKCGKKIHRSLLECSWRKFTEV